MKKQEPKTQKPVIKERFVDGTLRQPRPVANQYGPSPKPIEEYIGDGVRRQEEKET